MNVRRSAYVFFLVCVTAWAGIAEGGKRQGVGVSLGGFYRYGGWSAYVPGEREGEPVLEAGGVYRMRAREEFLFNPGLYGTEALFFKRNGEVETVVKGLRELRENERLALWFGYAPGREGEFLCYRRVGSYTFIFLQGTVPSRASLFRNVDIVVVEKYPSTFYAPDAADRLGAWLTAGGTAVLTSREAMGMEPRSVFSRFASHEAFARIRRMWREKKRFTSGRYWVLPAGLGRIVFFPADSPGMGIEANMRRREDAWKEIGKLSTPRPFPREPDRKELVRDVHALVPVSADDFAVRGKGAVMFLYIAVAGGLLVTTRGWKRLAALAGAAVGVSVVILAAYAPPPVVTAGLCLYGCRSGGDLARGYVLTRICSFAGGEVSFAAEEETPWIPLLPGDAGIEVEEREGGMFHRLETESLCIRTVYAEKVSRMRKTFSWELADGTLRVFLPPGIAVEECFFFTGGKVFAVPPSSGTYRLSALRRRGSPGPVASAALRAGRRLGLHGRDDVLVVIVHGAPVVRVNGAIRVRGRSVFFVGRGRG